MPVSRQIRYLRRSRDNWKENAAKKQEKIREYEQTIRVLSNSRENWKTQAKEAKKRIKELEKKIEELERQELERQQQEELERQQQEELERQRHEYQLPRTYAIIGEGGVIQNTILASREFMDTKPYGDAICIENTDEVKNEPGIGRIYDETLNAFIESKPYPSWILNEETGKWEAPVPKPSN